MIKISKLADYGIVLMTYFASSEEGDVLTARELAHNSKLPLPTVGKVLKSLSRGGLLMSHRGVKGGYSLARLPAAISVADMIRALDGPIALTECSSMAQNSCELETDCPARSNWQRINRAVATTLSNLSLAEIASSNGMPHEQPTSSLTII